MAVAAPAAASAGVGALAPPTPALAVGGGRLALALQDALTVGVRLRAERHPVSDAHTFRAQLRALLARAEQEGVAAGYAPDDVRLGVFAVVAYLDETVLNARQSALAEWARRPLQEELFGGHMAGEWFFQHLEQLLGRPDVPALADLLEVHQLCLLLGFRGRYAASDPTAVQTIVARVAERVARLRGAPGELAPAWRPIDDVPVARDSWLRRLTLLAAASVVGALALWGAYALLLRDAAGAIPG